MRVPHIVVVNDDAVFLDVMRELLESEGFQATIHKGGSGAHTSILAAHPDLIILDLRMEQVDEGMQLLSILQLDPKTKHLPVILCTADGRFLKDNAHRLQQQGIQTLAKPFDLDQLVDCVQQGLQSRRQPQTAPPS